MVFVPSANPTVLEQQLRDLLLISEQKLKELTSPVEVFSPEEIRETIKSIYGYSKGKGDYYQPPTTRFARMTSYRVYHDSSSD